MPNHNIIVVGASAGGVEAVRQMLSALPRGLHAALFVVLHLPAHSRSMLHTVFGRAANMPVSQAVHAAPIAYGHVYVAPPDHHLLLEKGTMQVVRGPKENRYRPAVDPLFRTAALAYGAQVVGVVLTGALDDGTAGLLAIKQRGGIAVVQDPDEAIYPSMPRNALANVAVDHRLPLAAIPALLTRLAHSPVTQVAGPVGATMVHEAKIAALDAAELGSDTHPGKPSPYSCPECGGVLWELEEAGLVRFRCRVGHALGAESVLAAQAEGLEQALWTALKVLEERASLSRRLAHHTHQQGRPALVAYYNERAEEAEQQALVIRQVLYKNVD